MPNGCRNANLTDICLLCERDLRHFTLSPHPCAHSTLNNVTLQKTTGSGMKGVAVRGQDWWGDVETNRGRHHSQGVTLCFTAWQTGWCECGNVCGHVCMWQYCAVHMCHMTALVHVCACVWHCFVNPHGQQRRKNNAWMGMRLCCLCVYIWIGACMFSSVQ